MHKKPAFLRGQAASNVRPAAFSASGLGLPMHAAPTGAPGPAHGSMGMGEMGPGGGDFGFDENTGLTDVGPGDAAVADAFSQAMQGPAGDLDSLELDLDEVEDAAPPPPDDTEIDESDAFLQAAMAKMDAANGGPGGNPAAAGGGVSDAEHQLALSKLTNAILSLKAQSERLASEARAEALELGFLVARRILEREVSTDVSAILALIRTAMRKAADARNVTIRLHPADYELVDSALQQGHHDELSLAHVELKVDPDASRGDVFIDTDFGAVDGRMDTRMAQLREVIESVAFEPTVSQPAPEDGTDDALEGAA